MAAPGAAPGGPPARRFGGREKWGAVAANLVLALLAAAAVVGVLAAVPHDVTAVMLLVGYTAYAGLLTLGLAVATALADRLPVVGAGTVEGQPAVGVRARAAEWWYAVALDVGLLMLGCALLGVGLAAGGEWALWSVPIALAGAWFGVRALLAVAGRRRVEALWLTADHVVHDASWGRERVGRDQVSEVRPIKGTSYVLLRVDGPVERTLCPRWWRGADRRARPGDRTVAGTGAGTGSGRIELRCADLGHDPADLAAWVRDELGLAPGRRRTSR
ncbi:hypothetical protein [Nocardioides abyssi]|uniref:PH domain-containing protein n=1 Tax=Nocardioides abyssi TaxID=3058370 RepID=A0ABT8EWQ2_9ACTN|nr:hypothetical protein [Nocardioides abyssi]MDN4162291.1 hypothetical protein [Nocardioides abyssi]